MIFQFVLAVKDDRPDTSIFEAVTLMEKLLYGEDAQEIIPEKSPGQPLVRIEVASIEEVRVEEDLRIVN